MKPITCLLLLATIVACCNGNAIRYLNSRQDNTLYKRTRCDSLYEISCGRRDAKVLFLYLKLKLLVGMGFRNTTGKFLGVKIFWKDTAKLCRNCAFPQDFNNTKLDEITVSYAVYFLRIDSFFGKLWIQLNLL